MFVSVVPFSSTIRSVYGMVVSVEIVSKRTTPKSSNSAEIGVGPPVNVATQPLEFFGVLAELVLVARTTKRVRVCFDLRLLRGATALALEGTAVLFRLASAVFFTGTFMLDSPLSLGIV